MTRTISVEPKGSGFLTKDWGGKKTTQFGCFMMLHDHSGLLFNLLFIIQFGCFLAYVSVVVVNMETAVATIYLFLYVAETNMQNQELLFLSMDSISWGLTREFTWLTKNQQIQWRDEVALKKRLRRLSLAY